MKVLITLTASLLLAAGAVFGQQLSTSRADDLQAIKRLEFEWNRINEISDANGKQLLLAEDSYHVGPSGRLYNKQQDIEAARVSAAEKQNTNRSLEFFISNMKIRLYQDVAVVTATGTSISTLNGNQRRGSPFRVVHVWEKRNGTWQLVVDQVTGMAN